MTQDAPGFAPFVGERYAEPLRITLLMLATIPPEVLSEAYNKIARAEAVGPMLDPTAWRGDQWRRADEYKQLFVALVQVRALLPTIPTE